MIHLINLRLFLLPSLSREWLLGTWTNKRDNDPLPGSVSLLGLLLCLSLHLGQSVLRRTSAGKIESGLSSREEQGLLDISK